MNSIQKCARVCLSFAMLVIAASALQAAPLLKPGQRLVFLGDSITEQKVYTRYVMDYFTMRYPGAKISFRNAGWSGDTAPGGANRLQRDVLSLKPDVVTIVFGMNDGRYQAYKTEAFDAYMDGMKRLVKGLKEANVQVALLTPGCIDPDKNEGLRPFYNETLAKFGEGVKQLATDEKLPFINLNELMLDVQTRAKADDKTFTMIPDSVHPSNPGQAVMAYAVLKVLGCTDQASSLKINAKAKKSTAVKCAVDNLVVTDSKVTFTRTDEALPTWFDGDVDSVKKYVPLTKDLNQYMLTVSDLAAGSWKITVQGMEVGTFAGDDLAKGVNLSEKPGPWKQLGEKVNSISASQENLYFSNWRMFSLQVNPPDSAQEQFKATLKSLNTLVDAFETARIDATANRKWDWVLEKV